MGKAGTNAAKLDGITKKRAGEGLSLAIEISAVAVFLLKIERKSSFSSGSEFCRQDTEAFFFLSLRPVLSLLENPKGISFPQVCLKIDLPAEDVYQLRDNLWMQA